jgi:glutamine amidotransferase-like uncharacterized protein
VSCSSNPTLLRTTIKLVWLVMLSMSPGLTHKVLAEPEGFFRDIFLDGGVELYSRDMFYAADSLSLSWEYLATESESFQTEVIIGYEEDLNGRLLYPDGAPRYRMVYTNGGQSTSHGESLGEDGRDRIRQFFFSGGSYGGSCAGAFISSIHWETTGVNDAYYQIWPGRCWRTHLFTTYTDHDIPDTSPLLEYQNFGTDDRVQQVYHTGGCAADENVDWPQGTEVLARFNYPPNRRIDGRASCWAYQAADTTGRIVVIGSHPEFEEDGENLNLMKAMLQYALDGTAGPQVKGELISGVTREMDQGWEDNNPDFARIGDRQIHHFTIEVPVGTQELGLHLVGEEGYDFNLYANPGEFAFPSSAQEVFTTAGSDKLVSIAQPISVTWYISVELENTVSVIQQYYFGDLTVLNGLSYELTAGNDLPTLSIPSTVGNIPASHQLSNYPNPFNPNTTIRYGLPQETSVSLIIYDLHGNVVQTLRSEYQSAGWYNVSWDGRGDDGTAVSTGIYFAWLVADDYREVTKMLYLK